MKNDIVFPKANKYIRKIVPFILTSMFLLILLITGCDGFKQTNISITETPTLTFTISPQPTITISHPTSTVQILTSTPPFQLFLDPITIKVTQMPVQISMGKPVGYMYLYQKAHVTLKLDSFNGVVFLNLDNISDTNQQNSDFLIYVDTGSMGTTFEINPTNFARYFYSDKTTMDYTSCVESFPKTSADWLVHTNKYPVLVRMIETGKEYCILTNEGRMAIVNMVSDSNSIDDQGNLNIKLVVTVYKRIVSELFIPAPTQTTGPSPTPTNRYSERGISDPNQIQMLNDSIQAFIDAIAIGDKSAIANMLVFPIYVRIPASREIIQINTQKDFITNFEKIFPNDFSYEFSNTTIENNVRSYPGRIVLECKAGVIGFTDGGKIKDLDVSLLP